MLMRSSVSFPVIPEILYLSSSYLLKSFFTVFADSRSFWQGTFVLQDTRFRWLTRLSTDVPAPGAAVSPSDTPAVRASAAAGAYLYFPCGLIRGALTNLGIPCTVSAEVSQLPTCEEF